MLRLKELREEKGLNKAEMAKELGMPYTTYDGYEKSDREPKSERLKELASHFGVSVDYLVGRTDIKNPVIKNSDDGQEQNDDEFVRRLMTLSPEEKEKVDAFVQGLLASR